MRAFRNVLLVFVFSLVIHVDVFAQKVAGPIQDWGADKAVRLCKYGSGAQSVEIVYNVKNNGYAIYFQDHKKDGWQKISAPTSYNGLFNHKTTIGTGDTSGMGATETYDVGWLEKSAAYPKKDFTSYKDESHFRCPAYAYLAKNSPIVYFSDDANSKSKYFMIAKNNAKKDEYKDKYILVEEYLNSLSDEELKKISEKGITNGTVVDGKRTFVNFTDITTAKVPIDSVRSQLFELVSKKYFLSGSLPLSIKNVITDWATKNYNDKLMGNFKEKVQENHDNGLISDDTYNNYVQNEQTIWDNNAAAIINKEHPIPADTSLGNNVKDPTTDINCRSILTEDLTKLVKNVINFIRFLGPLLVIVFTIIEFAGAIFSADVSITKPLGRFVRRLIAAALLFFLPFIIFPLFDFLHITMAKECFSILN